MARPNPPTDVFARTLQASGAQDGSEPAMTFNTAYRTVFDSGRMTIGLMTPAARNPAAMADLAVERDIAVRADDYGFAALWARDVPLMTPQGEGSEVSPLDDPFIWLATLAAATRRIAIGTAAAVLPLRTPLHLAKSAMSLDRLSGGRFILGLGSGDRAEEFQPFGASHAQRATAFKERWSLLRSAMSSDFAARKIANEATGGYEVLPPPAAQIPMIVVGTARQSLQWIAANADGWVTYHRDDERQQGRISLWQWALQAEASKAKPFVQSLHLRLEERRTAPAQQIDLGIQSGSDALVDTLLQLEAHGVSHVLLHIGHSDRPTLDVIDELGLDVLPRFWAARSSQAVNAVESASI